jgi:HSP20 family protein
MAIKIRKPGGAISVWRPFRDLEEYDWYMNDALGSRYHAPLYWQIQPDKNWMPAIEVIEKDNRFLVKAELPGMKEEDLDISLAGNYLVLRGEKKKESEIVEDECCRSEFVYGNFYRSIPIPATVDVEKIEASYKNGVLEVILPKTKTKQPKKIKVTPKK